MVTYTRAVGINTYERKFQITDGQSVQEFVQTSTQNQESAVGFAKRRNFATSQNDSEIGGDKRVLEKVGVWADNYEIVSDDL
jgi:hypothetical protein